METYYSKTLHFRIIIVRLNILRANSENYSQCNYLITSVCLLVGYYAYTVDDTWFDPPLTGYFAKISMSGIKLYLEEDKYR